MARHSQNLPDDLREPLDIDSPWLANFYLKAIGITILLGLVSGVAWIAWSLVKLHVLP
jgi:hypothetical protein